MKVAMGVSSPCAKRARTEGGTSPSFVAGLPVPEEESLLHMTAVDMVNVTGEIATLAETTRDFNMARRLQLQSSSAPTMLDSDSEDSVVKRVMTMQHAESEDSLLALAARPPSPPSPPELSPSSSFDSQLTVNLDPNVGESTEEEVTKVVQPAAHWSEGDHFNMSVDNVLVSCVCEGWFTDASLVDRDFQISVNAASEYIRGEVCPACSDFKIGITENPYVRWHDDEFGYGPAGWIGMTLLYYAPFSSALRHGSTGSMERALIVIFRDDDKCKNIAKGGEGASRSSPHFTYVVWM